MSRKKISEFKAKKLLFEFLEIPYSGISINTNDEFYEDLLTKIEEGKKYVLKVDQGVKQRKKKGLVSFNVTKENIENEIKKLQEKARIDSSSKTRQGFTNFILEEFIEHADFPEYYLAVERVREGKRVHYSTFGGIDIEENKEKVESEIVKDYSQYERIATTIGLTPEFFESLLIAFDNYYFSFLEINPLLSLDGQVYFLDTAVEVDSAAEFFVSEAWNKNDFVSSQKEKTNEELEIQKLKEKSPASFSFEILNPNGSLFLLLSGGGASLVTADEVYNQGKGEFLANYGEYSGSPNSEETYIYTKNVLSALLHSNTQKKALIISGGVANFTDVRITFKGIIKAMDEVSQDLKKQNVKVFVRRGGPHQEEGLSLIKDFLEKEDLTGEVSGPEMVLTDIVKPAIEWVD